MHCVLYTSSNRPDKLIFWIPHSATCIVGMRFLVALVLATVCLSAVASASSAIPNAEVALFAGSRG